MRGCDPPSEKTGVFINDIYPYAAVLCSQNVTQNYQIFVRPTATEEPNTELGHFIFSKYETR